MRAKKRLWILLRGLGREKAHWQGFDQKIEAHFKKDRCLCLDLPGAGVHYQDQSPLSIGETVDFLRPDFLKLQTDYPKDVYDYYLFSLSLGGMVATEWLYRYSSDFQGAVLINTSFSRVSRIWDRLTPKAIKAFIQAGKANSLFERERIVLGVTSQSAELHGEIALEWAEIAKKRPLNPKNFIRQLIAASRYRPNPKPPIQPLLILNSAGDQLVNPKSSLNIGEFWGYDIRRHPTAGHDLTLDAPEWTLKEMEHWLELLKGDSKAKRP